MCIEDLVYKDFDNRQEELIMLECIRHRAKHKEENIKIYNRENVCENEKSSREPQKSEKEK